MSEDITIVVEKKKPQSQVPEGKSTILADPNDRVPPEQLLQLLAEWKAKVESDVAELEAKKAKVHAVYKRQKEMYDKWLAGPLGKMKKFDKIINERKKVILDVEREIKQRKEAQMIQTNVVNGEPT